MKVLLDTCVWGGVRTELGAAGHDVLWTGDLPQDPGDEEILAQAYREQRVLITLVKISVNWRFDEACRTPASCVSST
jgi:predicted nuclease of predicted toxin-antitoxin system